MNTSILGRLNVGKKISLIVLVFTVSLVGVTGFIVVEEMGSSESEITLNMTARQRVLNQLYIRDVLVKKQGIKSNHAYWLKLQSDTLGSLTNGGMVVTDFHGSKMKHIAKAPTEALTALFVKQAEQLKKVEKGAKKLLLLSVTNSKYDKAVSSLVNESNMLNGLMDESVEVYSSYFKAQKQSAVWISLLLAALFLFVGFALSYIIVRSISVPLQALAAMAKKISSGDLTVANVDHTALDEVGILTSSMNLMKNSLAEQIESVNRSSLDLNSTSQEILAAAKEQASTVNEQLSAVQQTSSTLEEMKQSGDQIASKADVVGKANEHTVEAGEQGMEMVQQTTKTMDAIKSQVELVAENIVQLSEKTQAVGEIIANVNDISEQSHLLSLNASIEASSAGEAGKRFSVVASEMKNLADQAKEATVKVRSILSDIQKGITSSVMLTEEAVKKTVSGREQAGSAESVIKQFSSSTSESIQAFQQIAAATNQQQIGYEQSAKAIKEIEKSTGQTATATTQLEKAVASLNKLSEDLVASVKQYKVK